MNGLLTPFRTITLGRVIARMTIAMMTMSIGSLTGAIGYAHLCSQGSRWIEGAAMFGCTLGAGLCVMIFRRYRIGLTIAAAVIIIVRLLRDPYLEWSHSAAYGGP